ncbi:MAG: NYN domain-containing protein [Candidatus Gracilibacteria bacterium]|nr:NYN domain-containing protein [Candidatus Gracilibacteria bacterium]
MKGNNIAYIDGANLYNGISELGWELDYNRFRKWLKDKYNVEKAYIFIGLIARYKDLYAYLQETGYTLIFKETVYDGAGKPKGNCDADLVLKVTRDTYEEMFDEAIIVTSDGDYASLISFLKEKGKIKAILSPSDKCSVLLKRTNTKITNLSWLKNKLERKSPR